MTIKNYHDSHDDDIYQELTAWQTDLELKIKFSKNDNHTELK
jgi:hypothetical protein